MVKQAQLKNISQSEIAREAGVARTTVSLVLRGGKGLTPETIERVQATVDRLGYRPNRLVRGIRTGRTGLIGVMVPPYDTFWAEVLFGIHDGLIEGNCAPLVTWSNHRATETVEEAELGKIHRMLDWRVEGGIFWPWFAKLYREHLTEFSRRDLPLVTVDCQLPARFKACSVLSDETSGAEEVADYLLGLGHRHFIHFAGPDSEDWSCRRRQAFEAAVRRSGNATIVSVELPLKPPYGKLIREALLANPKTSAVYAATDHMAAQCYHVAAQLNLKIPEDLSIVGCGDLELGMGLEPPLTTMRQMPYEMGKCAAEMVISAISDPSAKSGTRTRTFPMHLIERSSVAMVRNAK